MTEESTLCLLMALEKLTRHRALNRLLSDPEYAIEEAIVFDRDVMRKDGKVFYAPIYMMMFLRQEELPETMVYDIGEPLSFGDNANR